MKLVFPNANTSEPQITRILFETKFCPSYLKGRAGSECDDAVACDDDEDDVEGRLVLTMNVMLMTIMLMTRVSMMMMTTTTLRGGGWCCPGDKCSSPQPDTLHFSPPRPPLPSVLFSKLFLVFVGVTVKVEILHRGQSDLLLKRTSKQPFSQSPYSWCKYLPNISFTRATEPNNIQLVPNI